MSLIYMLAALCLTSGIAAIPPDGKSILGYRTVAQAEADKINAAGAPVWEGKDYQGGKQIGPGVYTTPVQGGWTPEPDEWVCVIYADTNQLAAVSKLWVPKHDDYTNLDLWWQRNDNLQYYVDSWDYNYNAAKTLYMAYVQGWGDLLQLLIPPALVDPAGALGLSAVCKATRDELPDTADVNYDQLFQENIHGDRGSPG